MKVIDPKKALFVCLTLLGVILFFNIKGYFYNCIPATDFSIYQEAIFRIANWESLNPYIYVRNIKIFNDHFDPILILGAPFVKALRYHPVSLLIFQIIWPLLALLFIYKKKGRNFLGYSLLLFIFTRGIIGGLVFPLHTVTWSVFPLVCFIYYMSKDNEKGLIFSGLSLLLFKETYPFALVSVSLYYLYNKKLRVFLWLFIPAFLHLIFLYGFRERLLGPLFPYSDRILVPLSNDPITFFKNLISNFSYKEVFNLHYCYIIPLVTLILNKGIRRNKFIIPALLFLLPLYGIHGLSNIFFNWSGLPFAVVLTSIIIFSTLLKDLGKLRPLVLLIFIVASSKHYAKAVKLAFVGKSKTCEISSKRKITLEKARRVIRKAPENSNILSSSGFIPWSLKPHLNFFLAGEYSKRIENYDFIIFEKGTKGYITPYSREDSFKIINRCKKDSVLMEDEFIYIGKGPFSAECLDLIYKK